MYADVASRIRGCEARLAELRARDPSTMTEEEIYDLHQDIDYYEEELNFAWQDDELDEMSDMVY